MARQTLFVLTTIPSRLTLDIIGPAAMGRDFQSLQNEENAVAQRYLGLFTPTFEGAMIFVASLLYPSWVAPMIPGRANTLINDGVRYIREVCLDIVREKKVEISSGKTESVDILSTMLRGKEISDDACVDQMLTFLAAGVGSDLPHANGWLLMFLYSTRRLQAL